jgi:hypothetical protein
LQASQQRHYTENGKQQGVFVSQGPASAVLLNSFSLRQRTHQATCAFRYYWMLPLSSVLSPLLAGLAHVNQQCQGCFGGVQQHVPWSWQVQRLFAPQRSCSNLEMSCPCVPLQVCPKVKLSHLLYISTALLLAPKKCL